MGACARPLTLRKRLGGALGRPEERLPDGLRRLGVIVVLPVPDAAHRVPQLGAASLMKLAASVGVIP